MLRAAPHGARDARAQMGTVTAGPGKLPKLAAQRSTVEGAVVMDKLTAYEHVAGYNNFYEFGLDKADPARYAHTLRTRPTSAQTAAMVCCIDVCAHTALNNSTQHTAHSVHPPPGPR